MGYNFIILGGGWAGVVAALKIKALYPLSNTIVIEKAMYDKRGGLLRSEHVDNFIFDIHGSHVIFSKDYDLLGKILRLLSGNVIKHNRKSFILFDNTLIPYPFENGLYVLDVKNRAEAVISFLESYMVRQNGWTPRTFRDWIYGFHGKWIAEKYLIPYNEKVWKRPLDQIDVDWVYTPGRLPVADWRSVVKSAVGIPTIGYVEQSTFYYPEKGGIQALYDSALEKSMGMGVKIVWGEPVSKFERKGGKWVVNDKYEGDLLINTMPLPLFASAINAPEEIIKASVSLDYNRIIVVGVALDKPAPDQHWIYVPQKDVIFHRYAWISNYSPYNALKSKSSIIAEITVPRGEPIKLESLREKVIEDFIKLGIFSERHILFNRVWFYEYGYPIYILGHKKIRQVIFDWLNEEGITSVGRWGSWHYWNIDKVYESTLKIVDQMRRR